MSNFCSYLRSTFFFIGFLISMISVSRAQEVIATNDAFYYNNFDNGQLGTAFTQLNSNISLSVSANSLINNLSTTTGHTLQSTGNGLMGGLMMSFIPTGTDMNNEVYGYEWNFLYKNSGGNPDNSDVISNGENAWSMWLMSDGLNVTTTKGYYLTQVGSTLHLRHKYNNSADPSHYNNLISFNLDDIGGNNNTYVIRVQRLKRNNQYVWHLFVDRYGANVKEAFTERGGTGAYQGDQNIYRNSRLVVSSTTEGRFKFDEFRFYSMKLELSGANSTSNGISNPLFAGQQNAILYGMSIKTRGYFDIYQINYNLSGNITSIVQSGTMKLMRSADNQFGSADDYFISDLYFYNQAAQNYNFFDRFWSIGQADGSMATVGYYFIKADIRGDASTSATFSFVGAPVLQSNSAQINYVANGDVTNTVAPPVGSGIVYDWIGGISSDWANQNNWSPVGVPGDKDIARIGVNTNFTNHPSVLTGTPTVGNVIIGTRVANTVLTVNTTLNIVSFLTLQNAPNVNYTATIAGNGLLVVDNIKVGDNIPATTGTTTNVTTLNQTLNQVQVNGAVVLNGEYTVLTSPNYSVNNPLFQVQAGKTLTVGEIRSFNNNTLNRANIVLNGGILKVTGVNVFESVSPNGQTYVVTPLSATSTVEYLSAGIQAVYTNRFVSGNLPLTNSPTFAYNHLKFSGIGQKNVQSGVLNVLGDWTSVGGKIELRSNSSTVNFIGQAQNIVDNGSDAGIGVLFGDITLTNSTKQLSGTGKFAVAENAQLNVSPNTQLNTAELLTLKSSAIGFATVGSLTTGTINGNVIVEVYFTGGVGKRGTRMFAPPVNETGMRAQGRSFYQQMKENMVITGTGDAANGFDPGNGSSQPTIQKYNEAALGSGSQFIAVNSLLTGSVPTAMPGEGFFFAYRGNRLGYDPSNAVNSPKLQPTYVPESFSPKFTGTLSQGNISVTINNSNHAGDSNNGYNVVGNPYVSTIDWEKVFATNSAGMDNEIKVIQPGGAIMTRKKVGGVVTVINGNADNAQYLQPGQAFYVKKSSSGSKTFLFNESHKISSVNPGRYLTAPVQNTLFSSLRMQTGVSQSTTNLTAGIVDFRIILSDDENSDETALVFKEGYAEAFDEFDSSYLGGSTVSLSSFTSDNKIVAINYAPEIGTFNDIKLRTTTSVLTGSILEAPVKLTFPNTQVLGEYDVILNDAYLNTKTDIRENPVYNFVFDKNTASSTNRFSLSFTKTAALTLDLVKFESQQLGNFIKLDWTTSKERSSIKFEIEVSGDNQNFTKVGELSGAGDSSVEKAYTFNILGPKEGQNYIRIKQIYVDGSFNYSNVLQQEFKQLTETTFNYFVSTLANNKVTLSWETSVEVNVAKYIIETSVDDLNFIELGELVAKGTPLGVSAYEFLVNLPEIGLNSYRLKIVQSDNQSTYSEIRSVNYFPSIDVENFTVTQVGNTNIVAWKSVSERDLLNYVLEKSVDNTIYEEVGSLSALGATTAYSIVDNTPSDGKNYYRLIARFQDKSNSTTNAIEFMFNRNSFVNNLTAEMGLGLIDLKWSFQNLVSSKGYVIERSTDGVLFSNISDEIATNSASLNYSFQDKSPVLGENYYRIKHVFLHGKVAHSSSAKVNFREAYKSHIENFELSQMENTVKIQWTTSKEEQNLKFGIEKSVDGVNFNEILQIPGAGTTPSKSIYESVDNDPHFGLTYYRLKSYFTDNTFEYSSVKVISVKKVYQLNLASFVGLQDGFTNKLLWETKTEEASVNFEIERMVAPNQFIKIGEVAGAMNSSISKNYTFLDLNPLEGINIYRLKHVYTDGSFSYSVLKEVVFIERFEFNLNSFELIKSSISTAEVKFVVNSERNGLKYEIERSLDGISYSVIGQLPAVGKSNQPTSYSFNDTNPFKDKSFYRIRYINKNNQSLNSYSQVIDFSNLVNYGIQKLTIFPNPATDYVEVNMSPVPVTLTIFNLNGQVIKLSKYEIGERIRQNVSDLKNGMYILELRNSQTNAILGSSKFYKN